MGRFVRVASTQDVPPGTAISVEVEGRPIALFNIDGAFYAIDDECTHSGGSLSLGELGGMVVACPWHGACFDPEGPREAGSHRAAAIQDPQGDTHVPLRSQPAG
jgi:nitrite reductase/ring-hydroxylating ferredoxin subunit